MPDAMWCADPTIREAARLLHCIRTTAMPWHVRGDAHTVARDIACDTARRRASVGDRGRRPRRLAYDRRLTLRKPRTRSHGRDGVEDGGRRVAARLSEGARVIAAATNGKFGWRYYGTVEEINDNGTYAVAFDDGDYEHAVKPEVIERVALEPGASHTAVEGSHKRKRRECASSP